MLESHFKNVAGLKTCNFIKNRPQHRCFPVNIAKFLRLHISKNICERLLFSCFNGSLLHGPKGSRSMYDGVRLQGPRHMSSFLFLSWHLSSSTEFQPMFKNQRQLSLMSQGSPWMSQLSFYIGYLWSF